MFKSLSKLVLGAVATVSALLIGSGSAFAVTDYSTLTSAVSFTDIVTAILGVAAIVVAFTLVKNNIGTIMSFVRSKAK